MSSYTSRHTGAKIDDAVDRATGYGLGESQGRYVANASLDTLTKNGWYYLYDGVTGGPSGYSIYHATLFVSSSRSDLTKVQRLILATGGKQGYELRRVAKDTSWQPWEWVNPPMELGVEYRTTERYKGKPVYVKLVNFGALPNTTTKRVDPNITNFSELVDMRVIIAVSDGSYHINMSFDGDTSGTVNNRTWFKLSVGGIAIKTFIDQSADSAIVTLKYTKTTD